MSYEPQVDEVVIIRIRESGREFPAVCAKVTESGRRMFWWISSTKLRTWKSGVRHLYPDREEVARKATPEEAAAFRNESADLQWKR